MSATISKVIVYSFSGLYHWTNNRKQRERERERGIERAKKIIERERERKNYDVDRKKSCVC